MSTAVLRPLTRRIHVRVRHTSSSSTNQTRPDSKSFAQTLLLPKTTFPLWSDPTKSEQPFRKKTCEGLYRWQDNVKGPLFVLHDGPPYANGHLHMGHALNKIIKDIINRYHISVGHRVHYIPGWDCHGLPIENKALQDLGQSPTTSTQVLTPSQIRIAARRTALEQIDIQREEFKLLGIMADWEPGLDVIVDSNQISGPEKDIGKGGSQEQNSVYRTLDSEYEMRQLRVFGKMVQKGLIHRNHRPVFYSPSSRSALAEAELVYEDKHVSHSVYVSFELGNALDSLGLAGNAGKRTGGREEKVGLLVWTTTPWTLSANMAIAVNPDMLYLVIRCTEPVSGKPKVVIIAKDRVAELGSVIGDSEAIGEIKGKTLVGLEYSPIFSSLAGDESPKMKIIPASHVTPDSGTGLVHCAPAHGAEDYNTFRSLSMLSNSKSMICHVDGEGKFTEEINKVVGEEAGNNLVGKEVLKGGGKSVIDLLKRMDGVLWRVEKIKHRYPYDWKTGEPVIVTATSQWFANLDGIKDNALDALKEVTFFPDISRNRLESFVRSRSEWCISRQRVWGVPIPALHHIPSDRVVLDTESLAHILTVLEEKGRGAEYWWEGDVEEFLPPKLKSEYAGKEAEWRKGLDTMDVWFDSGTSWSLLDGLLDGGEKRKHLADVCLEGSDQHRGWFQSQLLTAIGSGEPSSPYATLITHGMVLDEKGKKMSKSLGNVVSPMKIINGGKDKRREPAYGADVLRLWAATVEYWRDMSLGPTVLSQAAESLRKIRNSARFILGNIGNEESRKRFKRVDIDQLGTADIYVLHELYKLEQVALDGYRTYNFPKVINALTNFTNTILSSLYFDITKDSLYADAVDSFERRRVVTVLEKVLDTMTFVMAPVLPHLAEEIHHYVQGGEDKAAGSSVFMKQWTPLPRKCHDPMLEYYTIRPIMRIRSAVLSVLEKARTNKQLKSSLEACVDLNVVYPGNNAEAADMLLKLLIDHTHPYPDDFLKTLFIVSEVTVGEEEIPGNSDPEWLYTGSLKVPVLDCENVPVGEAEVEIRVRPATLEKCPRCWTFTRPEDESVCGRCAKVLGH